MATALLRVACHVLSLKRPEDQDTAIERKAANMYGGHVRTKVMVVL